MQDFKNKKILITGANGLVGTKLCIELLRRKATLVILGRKPEAQFKESFSLPCHYYQWENPAETQPPVEALEVDAVIHLMGEPIADKRWTDDVKKNLVTSRVESTRNLVNALQNSKAKIFLSASAIGIYGNKLDTECDELTPSDEGFLGQLCANWEKEAQRFTENQADRRAVQLRIGVVLSGEGGALKKMLPPFEAGVGGKLGDGQQWMSLIHIDDLVSAFIFALENEAISGPVNAVSPEPVTNLEFTQTLAESLKVSALIPVPVFALKLALGEMAEIVLSSQKVLPNKLLQHHFKFQYPTVKEILSEIFNYKKTKNDFLFTATQWVPQSIESIFGFFSDENNLEKITPEFLNFHVVGKSTPSIEEGTEIDYKLKIHGVPAKWKSRICDWKVNESFRDIQLKGPYSKWDHFHGFEALAGGTLLTDAVIYRLPLTQLGGNLAKPFIKNDIQTIFSYRKKVIHELFGTSL